MSIDHKNDVKYNATQVIGVISMVYIKNVDHEKCSWFVK